MTHKRRIGEFSWRSSFTIAILLGAQAIAGCTSEPGATGSDGSEEVAGTVHLALATQSTQRFRLRAAEFAVQDMLGAVLLTLDSEAEPEAEALEGELPQGSYAISLAPGWRLEQEGEDGEFVEVQAALLSPNPREFRVTHGRTTDLVYSFATDAGVVEFGRGALSVGVDVVDTSNQTPCQVLEPGSCPDGLTCLLAGETGTFCAQPGSLPVGAECSNEQCVAGAQCLRVEGETTGVCRRYCDPNSISPICACRSLSFDDTVGVCEAPPECEPNCGGTSFTYVETSANDLDPSALFEFFAGLSSVGESDYLFFEIAGGSGGGAWCSANAAFYVNSYLALSDGSGNLQSGFWEKYSRSVGGSWSGPDTSGYTNYFGSSCSSSPYGWCSEWGLGSRFLGLTPWSSDWESRTGNDTPPSGTEITVTVGPSRAAACGF
ncbi:MAG TPA: hypothetical protein VGK73_09215 [Polyangiaceae bacterium]